ncbi:MAG: nuclear transport factor 2 family protein [Pseudomonadota bacterium]
MLRSLPANIAALALLLASCANTMTTDDAAIEAEVTDLLREWSRSLSEGRLEDFKAVYSTEPGFLWVERGLPLYRSIEELSVGVDELIAQDIELTNTLTDIEVQPLGPATAAFNAQVKSELRLSGFEITFDGIVTGIARKEGDAWKLYRGHLSEPPRP